MKQEPNSMGQYAYVWHDPILDAVKIGKTGDERRLMQRFKEALGGNPSIKFVAAWKTEMEKPADAGELLATGCSREKFGTGAREWFRTRNIEAVLERGRTLFGSPSFTVIPERILNHSPWDPFGNMPKEGSGASRLWLHRERRLRGALKVSDNSWWAPNIKTTWNNTFNPTGFDLLAAFEWPDLSQRRCEWASLNQETRKAKFRTHNAFGIPDLPEIAQIGWLTCDIGEAIDHLSKQGFVEFEPADGPRHGVFGQGEEY